VEGGERAGRQEGRGESVCDVPRLPCTCSAAAASAAAVATSSVISAAPTGSAVDVGVAVVASQLRVVEGAVRLDEVRLRCRGARVDVEAEKLQKVRPRRRWQLPDGGGGVDIAEHPRNCRALVTRAVGRGGNVSAHSCFLLQRSRSGCPGHCTNCMSNRELGEKEIAHPKSR
jgi:hypothetical protein